MKFLLPKIYLIFHIIILLFFSHNLYTVSNADFKVPELPLEYGFPDHEHQTDHEENTTLPHEY